MIFVLDDLIKSPLAEQRGIDNTPSADIIETLKHTIDGIERVQASLGFDIKISSGYRCPALNAAVGGSQFSQHMKGEAVDFVCPDFGSAMAVATFLSHWTQVLGLDQLIYEQTWVHVSFCPSPRKQVLTFRNNQYYEGIV